MSIDGSGQIYQTLITNDGSKSVLLLYQSVTKFRGQTLLVFQMVTEEHDAYTSQYTLRGFLRLGAPSPDQVVTDDSEALLLATTLAFKDRRLEAYFETCFIQASSSEKISDNICIIRIDIAYLIHAVTKWACFSGVSPATEYFFVRCIGLLTSVQTILELRELCTHIFQMSLTQRKLTQPSESGNYPNGYFCPEFGTRLMTYSKRLMCWTTIMPYLFYGNNKEKFNESCVSTSARSESYFRALKISVLQR
ncbi:hypothetical protein HCN44_009104 [Aphidius gifuensis]|uniref:Uncharacterized protein n=1 Tax=Aphidius gifuensis TaxID=684658 RepID=A0A834XR20_APHGI|nr:hypothetical protein HCN44_009104 [Aphidius gifuensis]